MSNTALKWGLAASLLVNAFLLGVSTHFLGHPHGPPPPPDPERMIAHMSEGMTAADAEILRRAFDQERAALVRDHQDPMMLHRQISAALLADPFDPLTLKAVFDAEADGHAAFGAALGRMMVKAATEMSPDGRRRLADNKPGPHP